MRSAQFNYKPIWEFYTDRGDFTLFALEAGWEAGYFTFHFAFMGLHIGRSIGIDN